MSKHFTPRKKKLVKLSQETKTVRIDHRTQIEVSVSLSNEEAIERYYHRHTTAIRPPEATLFPMSVKESVEKLTAIIDDEMLPDIE